LEPSGAGVEDFRRTPDRLAKGDAGGLHGPDTGLVTTSNATSGPCLLKDHFDFRALGPVILLRKLSKKINYFIEVKKGWYCLNKRSKYELNKSIENGIRNLVDQISVIKKISPNWDGFYDVYLGIIIIHGYHNNGDDTYNCNDVLDNIYNLLDKRKNYQLISSTWTLPGDMEVNWKKDRCRFVTIQGIVGSKKKI
ncbi:hypothetical protein, partial [Trichloromonas acetexigens]|uniref:hypothetical protein n=1 Tax=Trichloromonas acetexigens TaxID=38815 RepID=UPI0014785E25